ncbi:hypothetical protein AND_003580 [Anopheles darlingi]|uniref:Peptidase S1 domain-containing protein n=1 Tax=Anopheles darlingi TaxID=43151 RepID=W5JPH9_ANODA|nr:hypothetical protein AND_003580 [Anopheles darlingi]
MKETVKLILLALVLWGAHLTKAQQEESDVGSIDTTELDEQNGTNQTSGGNRAGRLFNGVPATSANQLYSVYGNINSGGKFVGGAIISNTQVLTSASAVQSAGTVNSFTVAVGSNPNVGNAKVYNYASVEIHKDFDSTTRANDVAIVTINGTFDGAPNVHPITIATREIVVSTTNRTTCVVVGYGQTGDFAYTYTMSQAQYELLTDQECTTAFNQTLPPSMLCARAVSGYACRVDRGGPLVCNGLLYGILTDQTGCTSANPPVVQKFAKLPVITGPWYVPPPRKNYVSCP